MQVLLEIACFNPESALLAAKAGAHRVEFCTHYPSGGLTPSVEEFIKLKQQISIPVFIMIRPRPGNFCYNESEFNEIKSQIANFKSAGADGFVFCAVHEDHTIHVQKNTELIQLAHPLPCTLHRAFDSAPDTWKALNDAITCGFKRILTSGGKGNAMDNTTVLKELIKRSAGKLTILPGGGVRSTNALKIVQETACTELHSAAITDGSETANASEIKNLLRVLNG